MNEKKNYFSYGFLLIIFIAWILPFYINVNFIRNGISVADKLSSYILVHILAIVCAVLGMIWIIVDLRKKKPFNKLVHIVGLILSGAISLMMLIWIIVVLLRM